MRARLHMSKIIRTFVADFVARTMRGHIRT